MPAEGLASFGLHHVDPIPIGGGRCCQALFTPLNIKLTGSPPSLRPTSETDNQRLRGVY